MKPATPEVPTPLRRDKHSSEGETVANPAPSTLRRDVDPDADTCHEGKEHAAKDRPSRS